MNKIKDKAVNTNSDTDNSYDTNKIEYDKDWKTVSDTEYAKIFEHSTDDNDKLSSGYNLNNSENQNNKKYKNEKIKQSKQLLITIQLILCLIIALAAYVIKNIGGDIYYSLNNWYYTNLSKSVIYDIENKQFDLNSLFLKATPDEA